MLPAIANFSLPEFINSLISLSVALILGTMIGAERQYRQRTAGLRTNVLVAIGAAAFVDLGMRLNGNSGAVQVLAYVASGVGFLGAGVIIKDGTNIRGLNTAATLWCSAAVGAFAGADRPAEAAMLAVFVLAGNTFLRPLVNFINRTPIDERATEATYKVRITTDQDHRDDVRDLVVEKLEASSYPVRAIHVLERENDEVEIIATLASTSIETDEIDQVITALEHSPGVIHATWTSTTTD